MSASSYSRFQILRFVSETLRNFGRVDTVAFENRTVAMILQGISKSAKKQKDDIWDSILLTPFEPSTAEVVVTETHRIVLKILFNTKGVNDL